MLDCVPTGAPLIYNGSDNRRAVVWRPPVSEPVLNTMLKHIVSISARGNRTALRLMNQLYTLSTLCSTGPHVFCGLSPSMASVRGAGGSVPPEGSLGFSSHTAAPKTHPQIKQQKMDGWIFDKIELY